MSYLRQFGVLSLFVLLSALFGCSQQQAVHIQGHTMGTTYSVKLGQLPQSLSKEALQQEIDKILAAVNASMSTYQPDSELSLFNKSSSTDWVPVSPQLVKVVSEALRLSELSSGGFDVSVGPLVNLWGFGPGYDPSKPDQVPSEQEINDALQNIGYKNIQVRMAPPALKKALPHLYLDLSAIAKGYGVDQVAEYLQSKGVKDYLVDIGGELRLQGKNPHGQPWHIAVEVPTPGVRDAQQVLSITDQGMATSGDYRNYFEKDGQRYSHTIDPTTGKPITHTLASASVVHPSCMTADGLATTMMVLGPDAGYELAQKLALPVYLLVKTDDGFEARYTKQFEPYLIQK